MGPQPLERARQRRARVSAAFAGVRSATFHDILVAMTWKRVGPGAKVMELSDGYKLQEVEGNLLLKRPNGYVLAAFAAEVDHDAILRVAEADHKYVRSARTEFLLALENAYRG